MGYVLSREISSQQSQHLANGHVLARYDALVPGSKTESRAMAVTCSCGQRAYVTEEGPDETYMQMRGRAATLLKCLAPS